MRLLQSKYDDNGLRANLLLGRQRALGSPMGNLSERTVCSAVLVHLQAYGSVVWIPPYTSDRYESSANGCENFLESRRITGPALSFSPPPPPPPPLPFFLPSCARLIPNALVTAAALLHPLGRSNLLIKSSRNSNIISRIITSRSLAIVLDYPDNVGIIENGMSGPRARRH